MNAHSLLTTSISYTVRHIGAATVVCNDKLVCRPLAANIESIQSDRCVLTNQLACYQFDLQLQFTLMSHDPSVPLNHYPDKVAG